LLELKTLILHWLATGCALHYPCYQRHMIRSLRLSCLGLVAALSPLLGGCVSDGPSDVSASRSSGQPRHANYRCGSAEFTVLNRGSSVSILRDGEQVELPASPAVSRTRYTDGSRVLVLDGAQALYFESGKPPLDCKR
jgi:membrane-bound inhibitor of C-type lysozyme